MKGRINREESGNLAAVREALPEESAGWNGEQLRAAPGDRPSWGTQTQVMLSLMQ